MKMMIGLTYMSPRYFKETLTSKSKATVVVVVVFAVVGQIFCVKIILIYCD